MPRPASVAPLLCAAMALCIATPLAAQGQQAVAAAATNDTAAGCCRAAPGVGAAGHQTAAADAAAGVPAAHALLLPGPHLRLLRRHEDPGAQLRPHRVHEPHVRPVRVRAGGGRAHGRRLSLPAELLSEEPAAGVHAGAGAVPAVDGHVHAAVGRVHAGAQPARVPGHGGAPAEGARARAALRLHGDGPRRRRPRQAGRGRRGAAARRRADGGRRRRRRHIRRGHRGPQAGLAGDGQAGPVALAGTPDREVEDAKPTAESDRQYAPLKITRQHTKFIITEPLQLPVVRIGDLTGPLHSSLITHLYSLGKPTNYTQIPPSADTRNATHISDTAEKDQGDKSEALMAVFLSYLRGADTHSGSHLPTSGTVTNIVKTNSFTNTVFQHLAHVEHSNHSQTTTSEHPTLSNATKITAKFEEKTTTASKIYTQFESHNSTRHEYTVPALKFPPARNFTHFPNKPLNYQKNSAAFAIFSMIHKPNNPFSIMFPLFHRALVQSLKNPLHRNNSLQVVTPSISCTRNSLETGDRIKCLKETSGSLLDINNNTNEIAHVRSALSPQHVRLKRSSDLNVIHTLPKIAGEPSGDVESHRSRGSEMDQHSPTSKYPPPEHNNADFPVVNARWTHDGGEGRSRQPVTARLAREFQLQARQAWGSMLGIMWCAAGVIFSGPSFWNVMACLLQAGQAFFG